MLSKVSWTRRPSKLNSMLKTDLNSVFNKNQKENKLPQQPLTSNLTKYLRATTKMNSSLKTLKDKVNAPASIERAQRESIVEPPVDASFSFRAEDKDEKFS